MTSTKNHAKPAKRWWSKLGPGLVTGASDDKLETGFYYYSLLPDGFGPKVRKKVVMK